MGRDIDAGIKIRFAFERSLINIYKTQSINSIHITIMTFDLLVILVCVNIQVIKLLLYIWK